VNVELLSVGTELLLGDILNTNAQYLSRELAGMGFSVYRQTTVGDNRERLLAALDAAFSASDIVITTGGLGPTEDDLTKETVFDYFGLASEMHEESLNRIIERFRKLNRPMAESNKKQALFPKEAFVLPNDNGTAPACIVEKNGKIAVVLPGPPREMMPIFDEQVRPYLSKFCDGTIVSRTIKFIGIGESAMEQKVIDLIKSENPTVAPYAKFAECQLRVSARAKDEKTARGMIRPIEDEIRRRMGADLYGYDTDALEDVVARLVISKKMTLATAESCTGGLVTAKLVNFAGASAFFMQSAVCYSNEAKIQRLGVNPGTLDKFGAVSEECCVEMAEGIARTSSTDIGISTTGIAGPDGGTAEKPVGLVYIGISVRGNTTVKRCTFNGTRNTVRERAALEALDMLRRALM
jgi:nicotinamide-nucleotide amidase